jgi:hypothetical protein
MVADLIEQVTAYVADCRYEETGERLPAPLSASKHVLMVVG